jgi:hypothetical protein
MVRREGVLAGQGEIERFVPMMAQPLKISKK